MNKTIDIIELIEKNPLTRLSKTYQSKFIQKIQNNFTKNQQQLFLASFLCYLNYNSKTDFVIEFESVWKWLGFSRKEECKRVLTKHFVQDIDYRITFTKDLGEEKAATEVAVVSQSEGKAAPQVGGAGQNTVNLGGAGQNKETILLTSSTFKRLALKSKTKKSDEVHDYFIIMEETFQEVIDEESNELRLQLNDKQQQLLDKQYQLEQKQLELEQEQKNKNWLVNRRYQHEEAKQCVYLYRDNNDYKIGKSEKGIAEREKAYSNMSPNGQVVYFQNCLNCNLTEKVLHHVLDKYRVIRNREWFSFSEELAIKTIKSIIYIMDNQMENIDVFIPKLHNLLEIKENIVKEDLCLINEVIDENVEIINPKDFDKFIRECCELSYEYKYAKSDIKQAHRVWSKCSTKDVISDLDKYLKNNFTSGIIIDKDDIRRNIYKGIRLKPLIYSIKNVDCDYEEFILQECKVEWNNRISYLDFFNYFVEWKQLKEPHYKLKHSYRKEIQKYIEKVFAGGRVHISGGAKATHLFGAWGLGHKSNNFGLKNPDRTNKRIGEYDSNKKLTNEWDSLSIASRILKIPTSTLSNYTRFGNMVNGHVYKYII